MTIRSVVRHGCEDVRTCPTCKAAVGSPCHSPAGNLVYAHKARRRPPTQPKTLREILDAHPEWADRPLEGYTVTTGHVFFLPNQPNGEPS